MATRAPSPSGTTPPRRGRSASPSACSATGRRPRRSPRRRTSSAGVTPARFDPAKGSAISWLLTIVHRKAVDRVRSAEASSRRDEAYSHKEQTVDHDSTAEAATASLEATRVRAALSDLTLKQRQAVELAFLGGYTHTEVARMLDLPIGTAKTRIRDGLIRLRDALGVGEVARHERHPRPVGCLRGRRPRRRRARAVRAAPRGLPRVPRRGPVVLRDGRAPRRDRRRDAARRACATPCCPGSARSARCPPRPPPDRRLRRDARVTLRRPCARCAGVRSRCWWPPRWPSSCWRSARLVWQPWPRRSSTHRPRRPDHAGARRRQGHRADRRRRHPHPRELRLAQAGGPGRQRRARAPGGHDVPDVAAAARPGDGLGRA